MHTSSSHAAADVVRWRHHRFDACVGDGDHAGQDRFHASDDAERPERGVRMTRPDACTVSISSITRHGGHFVFAYRSLTGDDVARSIGLGIEERPERTAAAGR